MFLKSDLIGQYEWANEVGAAVYTGAPSRRMFDRFNGYQVLFIINLYACFAEIESITGVHRIEALLMNNLPTDPRSEISVFRWLSSIFTPAPVGDKGTAIR